MLDAGRPLGRLFYLLLAVVTAWVIAGAQTPPTTTVTDMVYRADSTPASGTLLISWPTFTTSGGAAIAAGTRSVSLGSGGALSVALVSNANATPSGVVYTVVYQLSDGTVKTEYWIVPSSSPASLGAGAYYVGIGHGNAAGVTAVCGYVGCKQSQRLGGGAQQRERDGEWG